jgi:hypothetical protein
LPAKRGNQRNIKRLDRLRAQAPTLLSKPKFGDEFQKWHRETVDAIETVFGPRSSEKTEFLQIFERYRQRQPGIERLGADALRTYRRKILREQRRILPVQERDLGYEQMLSEAGEFLLALKVVLKLRR